MVRSLLADFLLDLVLEPLVLSVGHWVLGLFRVKPLASQRLDGFLAGTVGVAVWAVVGLLVGMAVS